MQIPSPPEMLARIARLPAAARVLDRLGPAPRWRVAVVGGTVRDLLAGVAPLDVDLVVEGPVGELADALGGVGLAHERFGTARVTLDGLRVDLAEARRERYPRPGALPDVAPAPLAADLERRDFTVNAIAVPLAGPGAGEVIAVPHALADLEDRRLRVLHPSSFLDDPTRLLRLARYGARLGFTVERLTLELAAQAILGGALATVSGTRLGNELRLLAGEADPVAGFAALRELGLDRAIDRRFGLTDEAWAARALELLDGFGRRDRLVLALAVRRLDAGAAAELLDRLAFSAEDREGIVETAATVAAVGAALQAAGRPSELAAALADAAPEAVALAGAVGPSEAAHRWLAELQHVRPAIGGGDLLAAGVPEGPGIGRGLAAARAALLDGEALDRAAQLRVALRAARGPGGRVQ